MNTVWFVESIDYENYFVDDNDDYRTVYGVSVNRFYTEAEAIECAKLLSSDGLDVTVYEAKKISW